MSLQERVTTHFQQLYGEFPAFIVRAPGRVNLIGEHTDYNDGFVLPMAIDRAAWIALRHRDDGRVVLHSLDFDDTLEAELAHLQQSSPDPGEREQSWGEYIKGVAWALQEAGYALQGWEGVVSGDVPIGAGLSSSAALEMAVARTFAAVSALEWDAPRMALLGQRAENAWVGVNSGIMDQMISATGEAGHALLIDCRSLETRSAPLPSDTKVVVLDTSTRRGLVGSAYNERREQCETAARFFGVSALRDVSVDEFEARADELDDVTRRRARHVVTENERTLQAADAMQQGDAARLGHLMNESHRSLRDDFEVSSAALNTIVEIAQGQETCYGARMTGAGFGGCAVALVRAPAAHDFAQSVASQYNDATGLTASVYVCEATDGARVIHPPQ
ncbi:MAG TPA: galactokinase [Ardenticatenaceae bacterium]|jgi:galactokinase